MSKSTKNDDKSLAQPLLGGNGEGAADASSETGSDFHLAATYMGVDKATLLNTGAEGLSSAEAEQRLLKFGRNELEEKRKNPWIELLKTFIAPIPIMIWIAILVEFIEALTKDSQEYADVAVLLILQFLNSIIGWYEELKAGNAIEALKKSLQPMANVKRDGQFQTINATLLVPGDRVVLAAGAAVPADVIIDGHELVQVDQAALTGESLPVTMGHRDLAKMGSTITRGEVEALVSATGSQTFFGKTAAMIGSVDERSNFQKVLLRITLFLMIVSFVLVLICFTYLLIRQESILDTIAFCVVLLVASIPIAMQMVCTTTMALGCRKLAAQKAIVSRLAAVEELAGMSMLCSDKTGTLTLNKMDLQEEMILGFRSGVARYDVLKAAALAAKWKEPPKDALDTLTLGAIDLAPLDEYEQVDYLPFDPKIKRTEATLRPKSGGPTFKTTKGAPQVIIDMLHNKNAPMPGVTGMTIGQYASDAVMDLAKRGIRSLAVAQAEEGGPGFELLGIMSFLDPPRPDTKATIEAANKMGVDVKMITGDQQAIAVEMCRILGMGTTICGAEQLPSYDVNKPISRTLGADYGDFIEEADGFAQVYPEHKFLIVEALRQRGYLVGMTGDGVNDAPALKKADVGVAVSGATDAARAAADIVLTAPGLSTIVDAIIISRKIFARMQNYVIYRIACTIQLLCFFFLSVLFIHPDSLSGGDMCYKRDEDACDALSENSYDTLGRSLLQLGFEDSPIAEPTPAPTPCTVCDEPPQAFKLPVIALVLITILNDGTIISIAYDNVNASKYPEKWKLPELFGISSLLGFVAVMSSILLLYFGLDACTEDSVFSKFGMVDYSDPIDGRSLTADVCNLNYEEVQMMLYLKISLSDFMTVFAARTRGFFFTRRPGSLLLIAFVTATFTSTILAKYWPLPELKSISWSQCGIIWLYCIVWFLIQDVCKVGAIELYNRYINYHQEEQRSIRKSQKYVRRKSTGRVIPRNVSFLFKKEQLLSDADEGDVENGQPSRPLPKSGSISEVELLGTP